MRYLLVLLGVIGSLSCATAETRKFNPSGVWELYGTGKQAYIGVYSWGKNPTHAQATVIDLGAHEPFVQTGGGYMHVSDVEIRGNQVIMKGTWAEGEKGTISIRFIDEDTIWFEWAKPGTKELLGKEHYFKRVPVDAPMVDPEGKPVKE